MEVKGTAVLAIRDYVKNNYPTEFNTWLNSLSPAAKGIFSSPIDSTKWYPVESGANEPTEMIGKIFFNGDIDRGAWESGRYSAERALKGIYKIFVKASNPQYIIKRASRVFSTYYRPCEIEVVDEPKDGVVIEMTKVNIRYSAVERRILGWMEMALEISGCREITIKNEQVSDNPEGKVIKFDMQWN
jgi:hypothetical protein